MFATTGGGGGSTSYHAYSFEELKNEVDRLKPGQMGSLAEAYRLGDMVFSEAGGGVMSAMARMMSAWGGDGAESASNAFRAVGMWAESNATVSRQLSDGSSSLDRHIRAAKAEMPPGPAVDTSWGHALRQAQAAGGNPLQIAMNTLVDQHKLSEQADAQHTKAVKAVQTLSEDGTTQYLRAPSYEAAPKKVHGESWSIPPAVGEDRTHRARRPLTGNVGSAAHASAGTPSFPQQSGGSSGSFTVPHVTHHSSAPDYSQSSSGSAGSAPSFDGQPGQPATTVTAGAGAGAAAATGGSAASDPGAVPGSSPAVSPSGFVPAPLTSTPAAHLPTAGMPGSNIGATAANLSTWAGGASGDVVSAAAAAGAAGGFGVFGPAGGLSEATGASGRVPSGEPVAGELLPGASVGEELPGVRVGGSRGTGRPAGRGYGSTTAGRGTGLADPAGEPGRPGVGNEPEGLGQGGRLGGRGSGSAPSKRPARTGQAPGADPVVEEPGPSRGGGPGRGITARTPLAGQGAAALEAEYAPTRAVGESAFLPPMAGSRGQGEEEYHAPEYLVETDDVFGDQRRVAPPVIG